MNRDNMTQEERINERIEQMRAGRIRVQQAKRKKRVGIAAAAVCVLAAVAGVSVFGISLANSGSAVQTSASSKIAAVQTDKQQPASQNVSGKTQTAPETVSAAANTADTGSTSYDNSTYTDTGAYTGGSAFDTQGNSETSYTPAASTGSDPAGQPSFTGRDHSGAVDVNGNGLHFSAYGKTTQGYNWRYEGGGGLVDVGCDYTFSDHSYDFVLVGRQPGSGTITVFYNTDDNTQAPVTINFTVNDDLSVSYC